LTHRTDDFLRNQRAFSYVAYNDRNVHAWHSWQAGRAVNPACRAGQRSKVENKNMKKIALFALAIGLLSAFVVGCTPPADSGAADAPAKTDDAASTGE